MPNLPTIDRVAVIGLGYVGLPLAVALGRHKPVVGFDIDSARVDALSANHDHSGEVSDEAIAASDVTFTCDPEDMAGCDAYLVTVPTPVDKAKNPDLRPVEAACRTVGRQLGRGAIVVLESTVYPGTTDSICGPILEQVSGLTCGEDFFLGYSPERINPGDAMHQLGTLTKVVAGQTPEVSAALTSLYALIGPVFEAADIRTAEAAKVIENAQRDLNIAFVNELAMIFHRLDIDTGAVLEAAGTKWNFLPFTPGLVGGHCIGVDPYYLTYLANRSGYHPEIILAGRRINDNMGRYVGGEVARLVHQGGLPNRVLMLGITFKENVRDIRNSGSAAVVEELKAFGMTVDVHDPLADPSEVRREYGFDLIEAPEENYGAVILAVSHAAYDEWNTQAIEAKLVSGGVVADIRNAWRKRDFSDDKKIWRL